MALIACKGCAEMISPKATACPKCGHPNEKASHLSGGTVLFALLLVGVFIWWMASGGQEKYVAKELDKIEMQVANDMVEQYNIAKRSGDRTQICVHAGMVAAAFLQAKDEPNYAIWQQTQKADCKKAGVPI